MVDVRILANAMKTSSPQQTCFGFFISAGFLSVALLLSSCAEMALEGQNDRMTGAYQKGRLPRSDYDAWRASYLKQKKQFELAGPNRGYARAQVLAQEYVDGVNARSQSPGDDYSAPVYVSNANRQPQAASGSYQAPVYVSNANRQPQAASGSYQAPVYVSNANRQPQAASGSYQAPTYTPNKKGGSDLKPGRPSSANWDYAKAEIAKHQELQNKLGAIGWLWKQGEYVAVNSALEEVAAVGLGPKPKGFINDLVYDLAKQKIVSEAKDINRSNKSR